MDSDRALPDGWHLWTIGKAAEFPATARATQRFTAFRDGNRAAADALTHWFRTEATEPYVSTYVSIVDGEVECFAALQSSSVGTTGREAKRLRIPDRTRIPATLVTHLARDQRSVSGTGQKALLFCARIARRVDAIQRTVVLVLDPFDSATEAMWLNRHRLRPTAEITPGGYRRLYVPLGQIDH